MSDWHELNKGQHYAEEKLRTETNPLARWLLKCLVSVSKTGKQWIAEEQEDRRNWDD